MGILNDRGIFCKLNRDMMESSKSFSCGNEDLDEFFHGDFIVYAETLFGISFYTKNGFEYIFNTEEQEREYRHINDDCPLNTRLMYYDLIRMIK